MSPYGDRARSGRAEFPFDDLKMITKIDGLQSGIMRFFDHKQIHKNKFSRTQMAHSVFHAVTIKIFSFFLYENGLFFI